MRHAVFIAYGCVLSWLSLRQNVPTPTGQWDKAEHLVAYAVFALLGAGIVGSRRALWILAVGVTAWGGLLEIGQSFVPGREPSGLDLLANALGAALGATLALALGQVRAPPTK